uniref:ABC1 domain-containing protein n=1 Tax=Caenorhabditis japonica TaxID=281687 RepID=A0A8R1ET95_CAEJA
MVRLFSIDFLLLATLLHTVFKSPISEMIPGAVRLMLFRCCVRNRAVFTKALGLGFGMATTAAITRIRILRCDAETLDPWLLVPQKKIVPDRSVALEVIRMPVVLIAAVYSALRKMLRCVGLLIRFSPVLITYPFTRIEAIENIWWKLLLWAVQNSGPTFIKLGQWASTRRDIFSKKFCDRLSVLHIQTKKKRFFRDKEKVLDDAFGAGFMKLHGDRVFVDIEPYSIGSGCIAQVYRGVVDVAEFEKATGNQIAELKGKATQKIAIKVADKGVDRQIELDLSILRTGAWLMQKIVPPLWYLDPTGALEQFEMVLRRQVDLRNEARALKKFSDNFHATGTGIRFPIVLGYTKSAIVETF